MSWYDWFATSYDLSIEWLYRPYRQRIAQALALEPGHRVLVPACGTGQDFPALQRGIGPTGQITGVDLSAGMLARAERRCQRAGWHNVRLWQRPIQQVQADDGPFDRLLFALALSVLPDWEALFQHGLGCLRPGGRFVIFDVHAWHRVPQSWVVERMAQADLSRRLWEPAQRWGEEVSFSWLPGSPHLHGGHLMMVTGRAPDGD